MGNILAIARKELSLYFSTWWAWLVMTAMAFLGSWFFLGLLIQFRQVHEAAQAMGWQRLGEGAAMYRNLTDGIIVPEWGVLIFVTILASPILSMGLFSQEYDRKTFELLMTTPVRSVEIVLGKYLGGLGMIAATLAVSLVYPLILTVFGASESGQALEWSTVLLGYLSVLLIGATAVALSMFISSLTDSQLVAVFIGMVLMLIWFVLGIVTQSLDEPARSVVKYLTIDGQVADMLKGMFDPKPVVFFGSVIALFLLLTQRAVEAKRWT
ncbi:MAG: ABC transporter permease subunit [Archangiaceae bacterium]|nr:ABC transporter permease subunit [Archangiaceae bacterium]